MQYERQLDHSHCAHVQYSTCVYLLFLLRFADDYQEDWLLGVE
jgi:hypothetical protein